MNMDGGGGFRHWEIFTAVEWYEEESSFNILIEWNNFAFCSTKIQLETPTIIAK